MSLLGGGFMPKTRGLVAAALIVCLILATFAIDWFMPAGVAVWLPYIVAVVLCLWIPIRGVALIAAAVATLCLLLGYWHSAAEASPASLQTAAVNRAIGAATLWMTALIVLFRKQLVLLAAERHDRYEIAVTASDTGTFRWKFRTNEMEWDDHLHHLFGLPSQIDGFLDTFMALIHPDDRAAVAEGLERCRRAGLHFDVECRIVRPDSGVRWLLGKGKTFVGRSGRPRYLTGAFVDITDRKLIASRLSEMTEQLERRVQELEAANKDLQVFPHAVAHAVRVPLRSLHESGQLLVHKLSMQADPEMKRHPHGIVGATADLVQAMQDVIEFSRLPSRPILKDRIDPTALMYEAWRSLEGERNGRRVKLIGADLPVCEADPDLLKEVFVKLLSNALKYTRAREAAVIEVGWRKDGRWPAATVYFVKDNGVGFDMEDARDLFEVFERLHPDEAYEGAGIGLAIVKRIIRRHGGDVWAEAEFDKGASFYFVL